MGYAAADTGKKSRIPAGEVDDFLSEARDLYEYARSADQDDREEAEDDNQFANASDKEKSQWDAVVKQRRLAMSRPVMQENRIPTFIAQVANDSRQNAPAIAIAPGDGGQQETADYFRDRIRHIEYESNADIAYDTAREQQVTTARSALRVKTEWIKGTFDQKICIEVIDDQFSVIWDPAAMEYDRSDAEFVFVQCLMSKAEHTRRFGKAATDRALSFTGMDSSLSDWLGVGDNGQMIRVCEYFRKEYRKRTLLLMGEGAIPIWKDQLSKEQYASFKGSSIAIREREEEDCTICQYVINGVEILSETDWLGKSIPVVPLWGRYATVNGKRRTFSLVRFAKEPQRQLNMFVSNIAEVIGQIPKTPILAPIGSIPANQENAWQNVNNSPLSYLLYKSFDPITMRELPRPERMHQEADIQALSMAYLQKVDAIKAAMGIFDASLGNRSNESSGIAIERRKKSSEIINYHFASNENRTRQAIGRILVEIIPLLDREMGKEYPTRNEKGETVFIKVGAPYFDKQAGKEVTHVLTDGDYGVTVSNGPSYNSLREAAYERDAQIIQAEPEMMGVIGDLLFQNDDTAGAPERRDRLKRYIQMKSPGLIPPDQDDPAQQVPPEVQQKIAALTEELNSAKAFAQKLQEEQAAKKPELEVKLKIAAEQEKTKRVLGLAALDSEEALTELESELNIAHNRAQRVHDVRMKLMDQQHQADMAAASADNDAAMQEGQQEHQAELQAGAQDHQSELAAVTSAKKEQK